MNVALSLGHGFPGNVQAGDAQFVPQLSYMQSQALKREVPGWFPNYQPF
jgi:hypothetical protein